MAPHVPAVTFCLRAVGGRAAKVRRPRMFIDLGLMFRMRKKRLKNIGQFVSVFGSMITYVAVPYQVYALTGSSLMVGLLGTVQLVPLLLFGLWGGAYDAAMARRRLLIGAELLLTLASLGLSLNAFAPHPSVTLVFVLRGVLSAINGFHRPALEAMTPRLVEREDLPSAAALAAFRGSVGAIAGPALGGVAIAALGLGPTYLLDVVSFFGSLFALGSMAAMPPPDEAAKPGVRSIVEGLTYARSRPELIGTYVVDIVAMTFAMPMAVFPALAAQWGGSNGAGYLFSAMSAGSLVITVFSGWTAKVSQRGAAVVLAAGLWGRAIAG